MSELGRLPKIDRVVEHADLGPYVRRLGRAAVTKLARRAVDVARDLVKGGATSPGVDDVVATVARAAEATLRARARPVVNATGVILHTNLGRAPLSRDAVAAVAASAGRYTSIEMDLATGSRGARGAFLEGALAELSGAEAALCVNNNAAAVLLVLSTLAAGRRVVVSRGELVEIGGGFRVPDVMARSGAALVEVGTTNKTRLDDYRRAIAQDAPGTAAILRVHQGNFRQTGFVERPALAELAALAREMGVLLIKDLGGGALVDLAPLGLLGEPLVRHCVTAGADVVCFSTDKVLGGPQGGAIVGRAELVERARRDPLARALRLGRLPLVALEATLAAYLAGELDSVPALAAMRAPIEAVRARAAAWQSALSARGVSCEVRELAVEVGGGTLADMPLPSAGVAVVAADPEAVAVRLREGDPPVVARIRDGEVLFDARTVLQGEDAELVDAIVRACTA